MEKKAILDFNKKSPPAFIKLNFDCCYICSICSKIVVDSYQIRCGCRMCKICLDSYLTKGNKICPTMTNDCQDVVIESCEDCAKDKDGDKKILEIQSKCYNEPCHFNGTLQEIFYHQKNCIYMKFADESGAGGIKLKDKLFKIKDSIKKLVEKTNKNSQQNSIAIHYLDKQFSDLDAQIAVLNKQISLLSDDNHNNYFIWKIDDFSFKLYNDCVYSSDPFYTHIYGYKICLEASTIGNELFMSIYFRIMSGEWDDILQWPFPYDVEFELVNPTNLHLNYSVIKKFVNNSCYSKPDFEDNDSYGVSEYCKTNEIHKFLINDTLYIKFSFNKI